MLALLFLKKKEVQ
nr:unnamed protein product [Callosobruchus analis]